MTKNYENPVLIITELKNKDVITASGGDSGKSDKESFGSLFGNS